MRIALVRHGETDWNRTGRMQGRTDIPMNETGIRQMKACGAVLRQERWDAVAASPLRRAWQSAELLAEAVGVKEILRLDGLAERDYGEGTGLTETEREERYPSGSCPGMESPDAMADRMLESLCCLTAQKAEGGLDAQRWIVVSHGSAIEAFLRRIASDTPGQKFGRAGGTPTNGSVTFLTYDNGIFRIERTAK